MIQTTLNVPLEVKPESAAQLSVLIEEFKAREDAPTPGVENFANLIAGMPTLHFMSMSVFHSASFDPIFIIEANFDGEPGRFWRQFEAVVNASGDMLRDMLRCCKRPLDGDGTLFDAITAEGSAAPIAPYLDARTQGPSVFHHGNRGLTRDRIIRESVLFRAIRAELDSPENQGAEPYRGAKPRAFWRALRRRMEPDHPWLKEEPPVRVPLSQRAGDIWRLLFFATQVLFALSLPGLIAAAAMPQNIYVGLVVLLAASAVAWIIAIREPLENTEIKTEFNLIKVLTTRLGTIALVLVPPLALLVGMCLAAVALLDQFVNVVEGPVGEWWWPVTRKIMLGQLALIFTVPGVVLWLRFLERRDSSQDEPPVDETEVAKMARREDWVSQNHMGSIVHIRPGVLRTIVIKAGHRGLGLLLRVKATDGYLGSMRTVHFAHWAFLNNSSRLLFFSNFDQSWGSYLDDFIEKAHAGLTLAWGCGVGFPPTRFLIYDGASHGRRFKNWALSSRAVSRFWFSAYPDLSVDQIERNNRIANGLCKRGMDDDDIRVWMRDL